MKINVTQEVDVPVSPYCKSCFRKEVDRHDQVFCTLFNRFLYMKRGNYLKCRECYIAVYDEIDKGE